MILQITNSMYPDNASENVIQETMMQAGYNVSIKDVKAHIAYLQGKGYITTETIKVEGMGIERTMAKMKPKGIDLLEGNIELDPGVEVNACGG